MATTMDEIDTNKTLQVPCVILGMTANGLSVARSLGRKGISVIGVDNLIDGSAVYSKYVKKFVRIPNSENSERIITDLLTIAKGYHSKPVLIATADEYVFFISKFRDRLSSDFVFLLPSQKVIDCFLDKQKTAEFCRSNQVAHPKTYFLKHDDQLKHIASTIQYPCIIKPQDSHIWRKYYNERKAFIVHTSDELMNVYKDIKQHSLNIVIQQIITGPDSGIYQFLAYCDKNSKIIASFCCRKIRQYPPHFGIACLCESTHEPLIIQAGKKLLNKIPYKGMIALEFKIDAKTQKPIFLEANLRTSFFGELAVVSGVDFPTIIYNNLINPDRQTEETQYEEKVKLWNIKLDLGCLSRLRKMNEITFFKWFRDLKAKKIAHTYFAFDDLKPWLVVYSRFAKVAFLKLWNSIFGKKVNMLNKSDHRSINILHFISSNGLFGAEKVVLNLSTGLNSNGIMSQVSALFNDHNPHLEILDEAKRGNLKTHVIDSKGKFDLAAIGRLRQLIRNNNINILHTHNYKSDIIGLMASRLEGIPVVATAHGFTDVTRSVTLYEKFDQWILKAFFNKIVTVTGNMMPKFVSRKRHVIPNGVDFSAFNPDEKKGLELRKKYNIKRDEFLIGSVGRLSREKNQKMLIEAVCPLMRENEKLKVIIVGDGPKMKELQQLSVSRHIADRVIFTGILQDVSPVYSAMDIFVLTSLTEGVPLTILEAMAAKVPVVSTRVGGISEIINNSDTGLLVDSEDTDALRGHIEDLIKDENKHRRLRESAFDCVKANYSLKNMCDAYRKVYNEVLN